MGAWLSQASPMAWQRTAVRVKGEQAPRAVSARTYSPALGRLAAPAPAKQGGRAQSGAGQSKAPPPLWRQPVPIAVLAVVAARCPSLLEGPADGGNERCCHGCAGPERG